MNEYIRTYKRCRENSECTEFRDGLCCSQTVGCLFLSVDVEIDTYWGMWKKSWDTNGSYVDSEGIRIFTGVVIEDFIEELEEKLFELSKWVVMTQEFKKSMTDDEKQGAIHNLCIVGCELLNMRLALDEIQ